ncbi:MAG: hypothetical protein OXC42_06400 [Gammaproteobacteria bacterium]|nr:hypothetical protein [Gammaproteobacteria bacterium]
MNVKAKVVVNRVTTVAPARTHARVKVVVTQPTRMKSMPVRARMPVNARVAASQVITAVPARTHVKARAVANYR